MSDARERILDACQRIIARDGLRGFRMQEVARDACVSIGLLSYHFGDRDGLLQAALDRVNAGTEDRAGSPEARTAAARLHDLLASEFGDGPGVREGSVVWNELRASAVFEPAQAVALRRSTEHWQDAITALIVEVGREHEASHPDGPDDTGRQRTAPVDARLTAETAALALTAMVEGLSGRWLTGQITADAAREAIRETLVALDLGES